MESKQPSPSSGQRLGSMRIHHQLAHAGVFILMLWMSLVTGQAAFVVALSPGGAPAQQVEESRPGQLVIAGVQVYPDLDRSALRVALILEGGEGRAGSGRLRLQCESPSEMRREWTQEVTWGAGPGRRLVEVTVPWVGDMPVWDLVRPRLINLKAWIEGEGAGAHAGAVTGFRHFAKVQECAASWPVGGRSAVVSAGEIEVEHTRWLLNGQEIRPRRAVLNAPGDSPGSAAEVERSWPVVLRGLRHRGFNLVQFRGGWPSEAALAAADVEGVLVEVEVPMDTLAGAGDASAAVGAILQALEPRGNHPSLVLVGVTLDEVSGAAPLMLHRLRLADPRRVFGEAELPGGAVLSSAAGRF